MDTHIYSVAQRLYDCLHGHIYSVAQRLYDCQVITFLRSGIARNSSPTAAQTGEVELAQRQLTLKREDHFTGFVK